MNKCPACRYPFALAKGKAGRAGDHPHACPNCGGALAPDLTPMGAWRRCGEAKARADAAGTGAWPPLRAPSVRPLNPE